MSKSSKSTRNTVGAIAAAIFVVSFFVLFFPGDYRFFPAVFIALLIALLAGIVIYLAFGGGAPKTTASTGSVAAAPAGAGDAAAKKAAEDEAARKAAEEAAAKKATADETARKAAEEASAKKAADEAAARKAAEEASAKKAAEEEAARKADADAKAAAAARPSEESDGTRPAGLDGPRDGKADDLKQIKGVGPKLEGLLNSLGFWHFDQVSNWTSDEVAWVDANLTGFKGRVSRDDWVGQAKILASGGDTEFSKRVEDGDVY